jgi:hypothetical protein
MEFTQSQGHGLFWDSQIRDIVFNLGVCKNDTKKNDIDAFENKFNSNENVSIKTAAGRGVGFGDIIRFFNQDFTQQNTLLLLCYNQVGGKKTIQEVIEFNMTKEVRDYLFGDLTLDQIQSYVDFVKSIPNGKVSSDVKKQYKNLKKQLTKDFNVKISINPKVDSSSQRRVQCSVSKIDTLLNQFPHLVISRTNSSIVRGVQITESIDSPTRKRNKK